MNLANAKVGQLLIPVDDFEKGVAFYRDILGLPLLFAAPPQVAFFRCGEVRILVGVSPAGHAPQRGSAIYFQIPDILAAHSSLSDKGVHFMAAPHVVHRTPGSELWLAEFTDPHGNQLALMSEVAIPGKERLPVSTYPVAIAAAEAPLRAKASIYPEPFASQMAARLKQPLGDLFGLANFGVNLTRLLPGGVSSLRHAHTKQDEFIYILQGRPTLHTDEGRTALAPGMCAGFKSGSGNGHHLLNETGEEVLYLEVGDRTPGDEGSYPDDDLKAFMVDGKWKFAHKDSSPY